MALYDTANNFFLSEEELIHTPSRKAGISEDEESRTRLQTCDFCVHGLRLLRCPQQVLCSAQVFIHRFYCKTRVTDHEMKYVAMAAAWLASKIEEAGVRLKDLIPVFQRVDAKRAGRKAPPLDPTSDDFFKTKQKLVVVEKELLKSFRFLLHTAHPHRFLLTYLHKLELENLMQLAWNVVNDSFRTTLCVRFKCEVIACGAIFMAARKMKRPLPENPPWYELFCAKKEELYEVVRTMVDLYSRPVEDFRPVPKLSEKQELIEASPVQGTSQQSLSNHQRSSGKGDNVDKLSKNGNSESPENADNSMELLGKEEVRRQSENRTPKSRKRDRSRDREGQGGNPDDLRTSAKRSRRDRARRRTREREDRGYRGRSESRDDRSKHRERSRDYQRSSRRDARQYKPKTNHHR